MYIEYYLDENSERHTSLPRIWNNRSPITWEYLQSIGWTKVKQEVPDPPARPKIYSKLKIVQQMLAANIWDEFWEMLTHQQQVLWNNAVNFSSDYPAFQQGLEAFRQYFPDINVEEVLEQCEAE